MSRAKSRQTDTLNDGCGTTGREHRCRPFLKWVGGKGQLLSELASRLPRNIKRYYEPFVGGGALFFHTEPEHAVLSDINEELIAAYEVIRDDVEALIEDLRKHKYEKEHYYKVRNADRESSYRAWPPVEKASRLLYLNKSCFNGLYRVNSRGFFNVPFGRYVNPTIVDAENLRACSKALQQAKIERGGFEQIEEVITPADFVYFDPPYVPLSATSYFTGYSRNGFDLEMQKSLFELCRRLDKRGVRFMLSNSAAGFVKELYRKFRVEIVHASRAVNSKATARGKIEEVIVTNYLQRD